MIFGDRISESPRVPSPWTAVHQAVSSSDARHASSSMTMSSRGYRHMDGKVTPSSNTSRSSSTSCTPPLQAVAQRRRAVLMAGESSPLSGSAVLADVSKSANARDALQEDENSDSVSTPPTDDGDQDGFFCLDADLDVSKISLAGARHGSSAPLTVMDGAVAPDVMCDGVDLGAPSLGRLAPEPDIRGNLEYKLRILPHTRHRYDRLLTQLKWRMLQGGGQCTYEVGVLDDGDCIGICALEMHGSLRALSSMADDLGATVSIHRAFQVVEVASTADYGSVSLETNALSAQQLRRTLAFAGEGSSEVCSCGVSAVQLNEMLSFLPVLEGTKLRLDLAQGCGGAEPATDVSCDVSEHALSAAVNDEHDKSMPEPIEDTTRLSSAKGETAHDFDDDSGGDDGDGATFSLSLDEQATRLGIGYQRRVSEPRRKCRYNARSAQQRQRTVIEEAKAAAAEGHEAIQPLVQLAHRSAAEVIADAATDAAQADVAPACADGTGTVLHEIDATPQPCNKMILEVSISRVLGPEAFIDYASL